MDQEESRKPNKRSGRGTDARQGGALATNLNWYGSLTSYSVKLCLIVFACFMNASVIQFVSQHYDLLCEMQVIQISVFVTGMAT